MKKYGDMTDADLDTWQMLPKVTPVLISRQMGAWLKRRDERRDEQEKKIGKWIPQKGGGFCCSNCKSYSLHEIDGNYIHVSARTKYCHNCGAKMEAEDDYKNI